MEADKIMQHPISRLFQTAFLSIILLTNIAIADTQEDFKKPEQLQPREEMMERRTYGDYRVEIFGTEIASYTIYKNDDPVFTQDGTFFVVGDKLYKEDHRFNPESGIPMGRDITGDGIPNLVITERPDIMTAGHIYHLFEIGDEFRHVQTLGLGERDFSDFRDITEDGYYEFVTWDITARGMGRSRAESPSGRIIMSFQNGIYSPDIELMREPPLEPVELEELIERIRNDEWDDLRYVYSAVPYIYWAHKMQMIYSGNLEQARYLSKRARPDDVSDEVATHMDNLFEVLKKSPYYEYLLELNGVEGF